MRTANSIRKIGVTATISSGPMKPVIAGGAVVHAATFKPGPVVPGLLLTIGGTRLGPKTLTQLTLDSGGRVSTALAGTRVLFDGQAAPLVYVSDTRSTAIVPYSVAGKSSVKIQVEYNGQLSDPVAVIVAQAAPGLFTAHLGTGIPAALNQDGSFLSDSSLAPRGSYVTLFGTGEGTTMPDGIDGEPNTAPFPATTQPYNVTIGGLKAEVQYFGEAPNLTAGVFQINVRIPDSLAPGAWLVVVTVGGIDSIASVFIPVK